MASGAQVCRPKAQGMWAGTDSVYTGWKWQFRGGSRETERHCVSWILWVNGQHGPYGKGHQRPEAGARLAWLGRRAREWWVLRPETEPS